MENALFYTLSTIAQSLAAAFALLGAFVLFRLQQLSVSCAQAAAVVNCFKGAGGDQLGPGDRRDRPERGAGGIRLSDETPQVGRKQSYKRAE